MKSRFLGALVLLGLSAATRITAQDSSPQVLERGPHTRVWQSVIVESDDSGSETIRTNRFTEIAVGLHFVRDGQWAESKEQFEETADGFLATEGQHQTGLSKNINAPASVELMMPDGQRLRSNPMGLSFFDYASGRNVLLGEVKDTEGELVAPNVVVYADCFTDIKASLRYTYTRFGFEQDVILHDNSGMGTPEEYGLSNDSTFLEMYSEFYDPPVPDKRAQETSLGVEDQRLEFGQMTMGSGVAYVLGQELDAVPVAKAWEKISGRDFLVESIPFRVIAPLLEKAGLHAGNARAKPTVGGREQLVGGMNRKSSASRVANARPRSTLPSKGFVVDYSTINSTLTNYVFAGDLTFYVTGPVILSGTNSWWEGGCVIKFASTNSASIKVNTPVTWQASAYRPVVMTSKDDQYVGQIVGTNTLSGYYATTALHFDASTANTNLTLQNLRISHAQKAIAINGKTNHVLSHVQLVSCGNGIVATNAEFSLRNALFHNVLTNFGGTTSTGRVEHLTVNTATWLNQNIGTNLYLTNCLLVAVTNYGSYTANSVSTASSPTSVFTQVGAGFHYLTDNTYRNSGVTNVAILADIQKMTTYPPLVNTNKYTNSITLSPQAQRDTDTPDRGYHYDPIDYALNTLTMTNATLVLTNGVAIAGFGNQALWLTDGSTLYSEGSPLYRNHLTRYANVQEQSSTNWGSGTLGSYLQLTTYNYGVSPPRAEFRFTDFDGLSGFGYHLYLTTTNWVLSSLLMKDCTLNSARFNLSGYTNSSLALTNNLFERVYSFFQNAPQIAFFNNLYKTGELDTQNAGTNNWTFRNNAFDSILVVDFGTGVTNSHNAYINMGTNRFFPTNAFDKVLTSFTYTNATLGKYYQLSTNLYDSGTNTASVAGLYHYTVKSSQVKETNSTVDIGFHYVALTSGQPTDTDGDGPPDYFEDRNGNGSVDTGETDWQSSTDLGLKVWITEPKSNSNLP